MANHVLTKAEAAVLLELVDLGARRWERENPGKGFSPHTQSGVRYLRSIAEGHGESSAFVNAKGAVQGRVIADYLSMKKAAELSGVATTTLTRAVAAGDLAAIRPGGRDWLIHRRDLEEWVVKRKEEQP